MPTKILEKYTKNHIHCYYNIFMKRKAARYFDFWQNKFSLIFFCRKMSLKAPLSDFVTTTNIMCTFPGRKTYWHADR